MSNCAKITGDRQFVSYSDDTFTEKFWPKQYLETFYTVFICDLWCHDVGSIKKIRRSLNQLYRI